jgi:molybdenum cofactor cytidylyltransferase
MVTRPTSTDGIAGVVLAAGGSSRMGRPKQLLPYCGKPLVQAAVDAALGARLDRVIVVTGAQAEAVEAALDPGAASVVRNPDFLRGNMSSLICGAAAVPDAAAIVLLMGDNPGVATSAIDAMVDRFNQDQPWAAVTVYEDRIAHPFLLSPAALREAGTGQGPKLLWRLLGEDTTGRVVPVPASGPAPLDVNSPEDYRRLLEAAGETPGSDEPL